MNLEDVGVKIHWCDELIKEIDKITKDKYPNVNVWTDTDSKLTSA